MVLLIKIFSTSNRLELFCNDTTNNIIFLTLANLPNMVRYQSEFPKKTLYVQKFEL